MNGSKSWRIWLDSLEKGTLENTISNFVRLTQTRDLPRVLHAKISSYFFVYQARKKLLEDTARVAWLVESKAQLHTFALLENALLLRSAHHPKQVSLSIKQDKEATYFEGRALAQASIPNCTMNI
jgi:hypothetical protein